MMGITGNKKRTFITYVLKNEKGEIVYVGRAAGYGSPKDVLYGRLTKNHHVFESNPELVADIIAIQGNRAANMGAEEVWYTYFKGEGHTLLNKNPPLSWSKIKAPISRWRVRAYADDLLMP